MGASGGMQLTSPTVNGDPSMSSGTVNENIGTPHESGNIYNFTYDFNDGGTFTFTGDFNFVTGSTGNAFSDTSSTAPPGSLVVNASDGTFTYTVTAAQIIASSGLSHTITIDGLSDSFDSDEDTINFTFILCFAKGTAIAVPGGETAVEALQIGDMVITADGREVPVKWVGHVSINPMFNPAERLEPVRIAKGAFGANTPHTDLIVTADHGMVVDDMVINASALINGASIDWHPWKAIGQSLTYYHVETDAHDVIIANGATSETYLDIPDRQSFDNYAEYVALYGAERAIPETPMPRITNARLLPDTLRTRLGIDAADSFEDVKRAG